MCPWNLPDPERIGERRVGNLGSPDHARKRRTTMAIQAACASSKEERILPLLSPNSRARQSHAARVDSIPLFYAEMDGEELDRRIAAARAILGERVMIMGHHYQRDEI